MDERGLEGLARRQAGVVARRQVLAHGGDDNDIERRVRRREWAPLWPGVYVDHTGPPSWLQRAWGAVLRCSPAVLADESALAAHGVDLLGDRRASETRSQPLVVAVESSRRVTAAPGLEVRRVAGLDRLSLTQLSPPRMRVEPAALRVASAAPTEDAAVAVLAQACQSRRTTAARLAEALTTMPRLPRRRLLAEVLGDVATGAWSALERRYLVEVERRHGLPTGARQRRVRQGRAVAYRDVEYLGLHTIVELDGHLGHTEPVDRWDDLGRDLASTAGGTVTVRLGWAHVLDPCRTAAAVAGVLTAQGWGGAPLACSPGCAIGPRVADRGESPARGAGDPPRSPGSRGAGAA